MVWVNAHPFWHLLHMCVNVRMHIVCNQAINLKTSTWNSKMFCKPSPFLFLRRYKIWICIFIAIRLHMLTYISEPQLHGKTTKHLLNVRGLFEQIDFIYFFIIPNKCKTQLHGFLGSSFPFDNNYNCRIEWHKGERNLWFHFNKLFLTASNVAMKKFPTKNKSSSSSLVWLI